MLLGVFLTSKSLPLRQPPIVDSAPNASYWPLNDVELNLVFISEFRIKSFNR